jgi:NADPH:quinone reductase-like Zn-dependent oxidoreductase
MTRRSKIIASLATLVVLGLACLGITFTHNSACEAPSPLAANMPLMKAMVYRCYGEPTVAKLENIEKPQPAPDRVLVKVAAAAMNPLDWHYVEGEPYFMRVMSGLGAPKDIKLGVDFAGTVEAVGAKVTRFKPGDRVFGGADGSFAEYVTAREQGSIAMLPANVSFEQGAAVPVAAITALQALKDQGKVRPGSSVLINGASGGVGTYAVQIAKIAGAKVTGVCSTRNVAMVKNIGADRVIDYTREDFTALPDRYDLIIDNVGNHSQAEYRHVLNPNGTVVAVGGVKCGVCLDFLLAWMRDSLESSLSSQNRIMFLAALNARDLEQLGEWMGQGKLTSVIDRRYALNEVPKALQYLEAGHARGKVIITVREGDQTPALADSALAASHP